MLDNKINILSTGALDKEIAAKAFDLDILIETIPFIITKPLPGEAIQKILEPLSKQPTIVVVTSKHAVEAIAANLKGLAPNWKFFSIGGATASSVKKYFGESSVAGTADYALDLARVIYEAGVREELYFFCGDQRRDELPGQLRENGIRFTEVVVYETQLTPQKLDKQYDGILFFSPSAVRSYFSVNGVEEETALFAIGSTTANELSAFTNHKIIIADTPDKEELVNKVIEYFKQ